MDRTRYNITQITNYDEIKNETDSEYIFDEKNISVWRNTKYNTSVYKRIISETYVRQRYKISMESSALHISRKLKRNYCRVTKAVVELVDIFPTIADLAGVPVPICQNDDGNHLVRSKNIPISRKKVPDPCSEGITLLSLIESTLRCQVRHVLLFQVIIIIFFFLYKTKIYLSCTFAKILERILEKSGLQSISETRNTAYASS